jgi:hypothetical protein
LVLFEFLFFGWIEALSNGGFLEKKLYGFEKFKFLTVSSHPPTSSIENISNQK